MRAAVARWEPALPIAAGCALLLARPSGSPLALGATYGALAAMALLAPLSVRATKLLRPAFALVLGLAAVSAAPLVVGPAPEIRVAGMIAVALNSAAAVSEEALFRRLAYGWLVRWGPVVAIGVTAVVFASIHVPTYGIAAFPVDLGAGLLFGWQRWASGSWIVPAATHVWANLVSVIA